MQTRRLRLGDVVDDYCPRERRLSNHVVVAMVEDAIKQTRCSTCDFEHPYKDAKVPPRRKKKDAPAALYQQVLDGVMERHTPTPPAPAAAVPAAAPAAPRAPAATSAPPDIQADDPSEPAAPIVRGVLRPSHTSPASSSSSHAHAGAPAATHAPASSASSPAHAAAAADVDAGAPPAEDAEGPLFRRNLIRAALPRPVGEVPVRQIPTFTIREAAARPGKFRHKQRPGGAGFGAGARQARPNGGGNQARPGAGRNPQGRPGGSKKAHHGGNPQHPGNQAHGAKHGQGQGGGNKRFK